MRRKFLLRFPAHATCSRCGARAQRLICSDTSQMVFSVRSCIPTLRLNWSQLMRCFFQVFKSFSYRHPSVVTLARLSAEPDDMYALISNAAFSIALGKSPEWQSIISNLESKSFHWSLSADPTSAVKSVAWSFTRAEHHLLTVILILTLHAKREPSRLDSYWLQALASVAEMPSTFGRETPAREFNAVSPESLSGLTQRALTSLTHFESETHEDHASAYRYIVEFLKSDVSE